MNFFKKKYDIYIVGAGPVGCVLAERFANILKKKCLIIEKRNHIAGNCYDTKNKHGILYHKYGPHYLRFKKKKIFNYLSKFTKWIKGNYIVKSFVDNKLYPFPINQTTIEKFYNKKFKTKNDLKKFIESLKINIKNPKNSEELILSKVGKDIYEKFYKNYTIKQWNIHPKNLSPSVAGRVPIRFNRNNSYVNEKLKFMPKKGYTEMFKKIISSKNIDIMLNTDFQKIKNHINNYQAIIYTGIPDRYFSYKYGKLQWRSLKFSFKTYKSTYVQNCVQYNFPNNYKFTRSVEIKHVTKQKSGHTTISKEYPKSKGDPYYPILNKKNQKIYSKYLNLIKREEKKNIFFEGRLAIYKYLNTDEVVERALNLFNKIKTKHINNR